MENLVVVKKGKAVTDTLTIAEVFGKQHDNVMRDVRNQINKLVLSDLREYSRLNFEERLYESRGKVHTKYELTEEAFALVVMAYTTPEAMKFKVQFLQEFKRMKEEIQGKPKVLSEREQLMASMKLSIETAEEMATVKEDIVQLKDKIDNQWTIDSGQQRVIENAKKKRVYFLWETGVVNKDIHDTRHKVFAALGRDLKDAFAVNSYRDILKKDFEEAVNYINFWRPRTV